MKVGILGAMDLEVNTLCEKLERTIIKNIAGSVYYAGQLNGVQVVVVKCGIGKVNAAIATQTMIDHFDIDLIINTGVAGSLSNSLDIFDIVVSSDLVQHDFDTTAAGDELGLITGFDSVYFKVDEILTNLAVETGREIFKDIKVFGGRIATGDQFISDKEKKERISKYFGAVCTEMEGCAIAQTCAVNNMPYLVIRAISDKADNSASIDYFEFVNSAAQKSAQLVQELVMRLQNFEV